MRVEYWIVIAIVAGLGFWAGCSGSTTDPRFDCGAQPHSLLPILIGVGGLIAATAICLLGQGYKF